MIVAFAQDQVGALPRRQDVFREIDEIDGAPQRQPDGAGLLLRERSVAMEIGGGVAERRLAEPQEALDIPALDQWALLVMALILAVAGFVAVRRW